MKNITLIAALLLSGIAGAQITYQSTDFAASGEEHTLTRASGFLGMNFASTGANHTWDYSNLNADSQSVFSWQNPNEAGYKLIWCLSNFYIFTCNSQFNNNFTHASLTMDDLEFMDYALSNVVEHSRVDVSSFSRRMRGLTATVQGISIPAVVDYDDPDEVYNFPMAFGNSHVNTGHFELDLTNLNVPFSYELTTQRTNTVEGWGSLTTPYGTFPNVLKLKTVLQKTEVFSLQGIEVPVNTTTVSYQWFDKDYGVPVLQVDGFTLFGMFVPLNATYLDGPQCLEPEAAFDMIANDYNGDSGSAQVAFTNTSINFDNASWDFGDGETASGLNASHEYSCPGTYNVTLTVSNSTCQPAASTSVTFPVTISDSQNALTNAVTVDGLGLTAVRAVPGTTYQWVDCDNNNAPVDGATSQLFLPAVTGNYACLMNTNGCEAVSDCTAFEVLGRGDAALSSVALFPNPTTGLLQLSGNLTHVEVAVFNALGALVGRSLDLSGQPSGVYLVKITASEGMVMRKVIKQ